MRTLLRVFTQQPLAAKVPEVTVLFWVIKISTTAAGEAISDMFVHRTRQLGFVVEVVRVRRRARRCSSRPGATSAITYWFLALAIATAGTGVADTMHLVFGMPYAVTSLFWLVVLGGRLLPLEPQRAHARHPLHHDQPAGEVLLGHRLRHVRPGHRRRGLHRHDARAGLPGVGAPLLRRHPHPVGRLAASSMERASSPSGSPTSSPGRSARPSPTTSARPQTSAAPASGTGRRRCCHHTARRGPGRLHGDGPLRHPVARRPPTPTAAPRSPAAPSRHGVQRRPCAP